MYCTRRINDDYTWVGADGRRLAMFEGVFDVPAGISFNSYLLRDEKTVLFDTTDAAVRRTFRENLLHALEGRSLDCVVVHHMEPDHTAELEELVLRFPEVQIYCSAMAKTMMTQFFGPGFQERIHVVKEGDTLCTGRHTLRFIAAPMVHWPEVLMTYDETDRLLLTADAFGCFGTLDGGITDSQLNTDKYWSEMVRYYSNIVGKYGPAVQTALKKLSDIEIKTICSTHGPIWEKEITRVIGIYDRLSRYEGELGVVIAYGSMYGHTEQMAEEIARELAANGIKEIVLHNVSHEDPSYILQNIFRYRGLIIGSPTYSNRLFPAVETLTEMIATRDIKNRTFAYFGSFTWAGAAVKHLAAFAESMKWETIPCCIEMKQSITPAIKEQCRNLAQEMAARLTR